MVAEAGMLGDAVARGAGKCPSFKILFHDLIAKEICCAFTFPLIAVPVL